MGMSDEGTEQKKPHHSVKLPYLYKEGSKILQAYSEKKGSLKSLVYATRQERLYRRLLALVSRAVQHTAAIDAALAAVGLPAAEPGLAASTARLLAAELLFGSGQLGSQARPVLTMLRYADRLRAAAPAAGAAAGGPPSVGRPPPLPRYARVNTLLASVDDVIQQLTTEGWEQVEYPSDVTYEEFIAQVKSLSTSQYLRDLHVPCLLVFPPGTELHEHQLYRGGQLILQDKASCLPPLVLAPSPGEEVIDACSAPGMKTSQLAAMMNNSGTLVAVERDRARFQTLSAMLRRAGVTNARLVCGDFLRLRPEDHPSVTAILLDPSCSGTGMVSRAPQEPPTPDRLHRLANLQGMLLRHALSFPAVRRVVYSTCSVTEQENEQVVAATLAAHPHWRLAAAAPATWQGRARTSLPDGERCIRAAPAADLCHGFFVAAFEKVDGELVEANGKKKKKPRQNVTAGTGESDGVLIEASGKKKRKKRERECGESGDARDEPTGAKKRGLKVTLDAAGSGDVLAEVSGKKKKKKRGRSVAAETDESGESVQTKRARNEEALVETSSGKETATPHVKKRKRSKAGKNVSEARDGSAAMTNGGGHGDVLEKTVKTNGGTNKLPFSHSAVNGAKPDKRAKAPETDNAKLVKPRSRRAKVKNRTGKRLSKRRRMAMKKKPAVILD